MRMDEGLSEEEGLSAAHITRETDEDDYEEEGYDQLQLLDIPWQPLPTATLDPLPPVLQMTTRQQKALAGETQFPECKERLCDGCGKGCEKRVGGEVQLWCGLCQKGRPYLCRSRSRCIKWTENEFQRFSDLQAVHEVLQPLTDLTPALEPAQRSGAVSEHPGGEAGQGEGEEAEGLPVQTEPSQPTPSYPIPTSVANFLQRQGILSVRPKRISTPRRTGKEVKFNDEEGTPILPPISATTSEVVSSSPSKGSENLTQHSSPEEKHLEGPKEDSRLRGRYLGQQLHVQQPNHPVKQQRVAEVERMEGFERARTYGASALSPSPFPSPPQAQTGTPDGESRLKDNNVFRKGESWRESKTKEWDGQGLFRQSTGNPSPMWEQGETAGLWTQRDRMQVTAEDSFFSPMVSSPEQKEQSQQRKESRFSNVFLRPPRFVPTSPAMTSGGQQSTLRRPDQSFFDRQTPRERDRSGSEARTETPEQLQGWSTPRREGVEQRRRLVPRGLMEEEQTQPSRQFGDLRGVSEQQEEEEGRWEQPEDQESHDNQLKIASILEKLTNRLDQPSLRRPALTQQSTLKMPSLQLPSIKRSSTNEVTPRAYFSWKLALSTVVHLHGVNPDAALVYYATTPRLLPEEYITIMANSSSLAEAISSLDTLHPSLASIRPELVRALTDLPPLQNASEKTRIHRISTLLRLLDEFLKYFGGSPHRDLTRQDILVVLYHFYGTSESRSELVKEVMIMEESKQEGVMYAESLKRYLTKIRCVLVDVVSALQLVGRSDQISKGKSAATRMKMDEKRREEVQKKETTFKENKASCLLCQGSHATFACHEQLKLIRDGKKKLDAKICSSCLGKREQNHPEDCAVRRSLKDGVFVLTNFKCSKGCGTHFRLCGHQAGPQQAVDPDQTKHQRSAAARAKQVEKGEEDQTATASAIAVKNTAVAAAAISAASADAAEGDVVFLSENLYLLGKDGRTQECVVSYDTHGSKSFLAGQISDNFIHSEPENRQFQIDTINGKDISSRSIYKVQLLTLNGKLNLEAVGSTWVEAGQEPQLDEETAQQFNIHVPTVENKEGEALPRIILSAAKIQLHPRAAVPEVGLQERHPQLGLFRSRLSHRLICGGTLGLSSVPY